MNEATEFQVMVVRVENDFFLLSVIIFKVTTQFTYALISSY